uniref:Transposase n=1 Tax=Peronospora matthiolae TaxID=2874970 RepID=A0AAV1TIA3_9STRA
MAADTLFVKSSVVDALLKSLESDRVWANGTFLHRGQRSFQTDWAEVALFKSVLTLSFRRWPMGKVSNTE